MEKIVERFLSYIAIDTMSDPKSTTVLISNLTCLISLKKSLKHLV